MLPCYAILSALAFSVHVSDKEDDAEHDAEGANNNVADGQEVVLATENVSGRNDEVLVPTEAANIVVILDLDFVFSCLKISIDFTVELAEVR